jgi:hypothetical protein
MSGLGGELGGAGVAGVGERAADVPVGAGGGVDVSKVGCANATGDTLCTPT